MSRNREVALQQVRNIGIIAHIDAGKTTLTERILYYTGQIHRIGEVHDGNTTMDSMVQEQQHGITIMAAAATCFWQDCQFNLIDTPGHVDFTVEVQRSLRVLDGGVVVFDGVAGVEPQTETVWRQADQYGVPRIGFVNKLDRTGADFYATLKMIETRLGARPVAVQLPIGQEQAFQGLVDLIEQRAILFDEASDEPRYAPIPPEMAEEVWQWRQRLIEQLADCDDSFMLEVLDGLEPTPARLRAVLRQAVLNRRLVPVLAGSALKNKGVQPLLDAIVDYLPSPLDRPAVVGHDPQSGEEIERPADPTAPLCALVFKVVADRHSGRLAFVRVYSGRLEAGSYLLNAPKGRSEHIGRLVRLQGGKQQPVEAVGAGDIAAVIGLKASFTGDTLCDPAQPVVLEAISFPEPVLDLALEPTSRVESTRLVAALQRLAEEDPTFRVASDPESGQTIVSGMGELHLEIIVDRLRRDYNVAVRVGQPQVAYRETIRASGRGVGRYVHQAGGSGHYGHVELEVEPLERGKGFEFVNRTVGGQVPREFWTAIEQGVRETLQSGVVAGYPALDVRVILTGGAAHVKDSSADDFRIAASLAVKEAVRVAQPVILEPVMAVEVATPAEFLGDILGDLAARRGQIKATEVRTGQSSLIQASVPLGQMFGYVSQLRSRSQGRASFVMQFDRYEPLPPTLQTALMAKSA